MRYTAPIADMLFVLDTVAGLERDEAVAVLEGAGRLCSDVLAPLNATGDAEGCVFDGGAVRTPAGFRGAYDQFRCDGWCGLACDPAHGGQGLPRCLDVLVTEMICSANLAFGITPGLSAGAYRTIKAHGSADLAAFALPRLAAGEWTGTMCLSEPHCGTDLGLVRTRAHPAADGAWRVSGAKIFASAGEHDLAANILHLVLARAPGAPAGTSGLSLFLVPKILPDGSRNGVACTGVERKMGIHASPTCALSFEDARGWLVGPVHRGMKAMFTMMNDERLAVGLQGLGLAEAALQGAVAWARDRLQGRGVGGTVRPDLPADPIIVHPDVRRMLLTMRAFTEGMRAMAVWVAWHADRPGQAESDDLVSLCTPVVKALFTDLGFEVANLGLQVMGGHGYIRDNGMEQIVRDARIGQIYEGTNGIQALDLVGRKLPAHAGRLARRFFHPVQAELPGLGVPALETAFARLQRATLALAQASPAEAEASAVEYLHLFGLVAMGVLWARMARHGDAAKRATARFYFERLLPRTHALAAGILAGGRSVTEFDVELF